MKEKLLEVSQNILGDYHDGELQRSEGDQIIALKQIVMHTNRMYLSIYDS